MNCPQCNTALNPNAQFCPNCGSAVSQPIAPSYMADGGAQQNTLGLDNPGSFFSALFDFSFSQFVTTRLIKVLYILSIIVIGLAAVVFLIAGLTQGTASAILALVLAPLFFLIYVIFARVWMEIIIVIFRIAENTREIARQGRR